MASGTSCPAQATPLAPSPGEGPGTLRYVFSNSKEKACFPRDKHTVSGYLDGVFDTYGVQAADRVRRKDELQPDGPACVRRVSLFDI